MAGQDMIVVDRRAVCSEAEKRARTTMYPFQHGEEADVCGRMADVFQADQDKQDEMEQDDRAPVGDADGFPGGAGEEEASDSGIQ